MTSTTDPEGGNRPAAADEPCADAVAEPREEPAGDGPSEDEAHDEEPPAGDRRDDEPEDEADDGDDGGGWWRLGLRPSTIVLIVCALGWIVGAALLTRLRLAPSTRDVLLGLPPLVAAGVWLRRMRFGNATVAIVLGALTFYGIYFGYTTFGQRNHDGPSHLEYVRYVVAHWWPPERDLCFVCHHPPAYYYAAAAVYRGCEVTRLADPVRGIQALSLVLCFAFVAFAALTVRRFTRRAGVVALATALVAFWPYTILNSVRLHNDVMVSTAMAGCLYFLTCWYQRGHARDIWLSSALAVLAVLSKSSGYVMVGVIGLIGLLKLYQGPARLARLKHLVPALVVMAAVSGVFAIKHGPESESDLRHRTFGTAYEINPRDYVGNEPYNYLYFDLAEFLREPYVMARLDGSGRQLFWNHLLKSSLFATHNTTPDAPTSYRYNRRIAEMMNFLLLGMVAFVVVGLLGSRPTRRARYAVLSVFAVALLGAHIAFKITIPHAHHNDFRMSYPLLIPFCFAFAQSVEALRRRRLLAGRLGTAIGWLFVGLAIVYYLPKYDLVMRYLPKKVLRIPERDFKTPKAERTDWDKPGNVILSGDEVIEIELAPARQVTSVEVSCDHNDRYVIELFGQKELRRLVVGPKLDEGFKGLARYRPTVDPPVDQVRAVRVMGVQGDKCYSVGHLVVNPVAATSPGAEPLPAPTTTAGAPPRSPLP